MKSNVITAKQAFSDGIKPKDLRNVAKFNLRELAKEQKSKEPDQERIERLKYQADKLKEVSNELHEMYQEDYKEQNNAV